MLIDDLKTRLVVAMKAQDNVAKNAIRGILSKAQVSGKETDESIISYAKMLIKQNEEEIETRNGRVKMSDGSIREVAVSDQKELINVLNGEIKVLKEFLPIYLHEDQIREILSENLVEIKGAKTGGASIGIAMKILSKHGPVEGGVVKKVISSLLNLS